MNMTTPQLVEAHADLRRQCLEAIELAECSLLIVDRATLKARKVLNRLEDFAVEFDLDADDPVEAALGLDVLRELLETQAAWIMSRVSHRGDDPELASRDAKTMLSES